MAVRTQMAELRSSHQEERGELLAKNIARTAGRQLEGRHLLFGEYFSC